MYMMTLVFHQGRKTQLVNQGANKACGRPVYTLQDTLPKEQYCTICQNMGKVPSEIRRGGFK